MRLDGRDRQKSSGGSDDGYLIPEGSQRGEIIDILKIYTNDNRNTILPILFAVDHNGKRKTATKWFAINFESFADEVMAAFNVNDTDDLKVGMICELKIKHEEYNGKLTNSIVKVLPAAGAGVAASTQGSGSMEDFDDEDVPF